MSYPAHSFPSTPSHHLLDNDHDERPPPSMSDILLDPLNQLQTLSHQLFLSLGPTQARGPPPPPTSSFLAVNATLASAVQLARRHQVKQRAIERLKSEVLALDTRWREIVCALEQGTRELAALVKEGDERIKAIEDAQAGVYIVLLAPVALTGPRQRPSRTLSSSRTRRASPRSLPHRRTCQTSRYLASRLPRSSSRRSRTKRRCGAAT